MILRFCLLVSLLMIVFLQATFAQVAEKIYGKNKVLKPNEYYLEQLDLWEIEVDKNPTNADAWFNYYRANRNAYIKGEEIDSKEAKGISRFKRLAAIVDSMEFYVPTSFEYYFVKWSNGNNDSELFPYLEKAYSLQSNNFEVLSSLLFYYEIHGNELERNKIIRTYYELHEFSPGLLNYSYNMLAGLAENTILFTEGDKDTEAAFLLQFGNDYRSDVTILNVNLLLMEEYRRYVFAKLGIESLEYDPMENTENFERFRLEIVEHVSKKFGHFPVSIAVNVRDEYYKHISKQLYVTGLTYKLNHKKFNAIKALQKNVEENYKLEYLQTDYPNDISVGNVHSMNENYILPFSMLSKYYKKSKELDKSNHYKELALKLAQLADRMDLYEAYFNKK